MRLELCKSFDSRAEWYVKQAVSLDYQVFQDGTSYYIEILDNSTYVSPSAKFVRTETGLYEFQKNGDEVVLYYKKVEN